MLQGEDKILERARRLTTATEYSIYFGFYRSILCRKNYFVLCFDSANVVSPVSVEESPDE